MKPTRASTERCAGWAGLGAFAIFWLALLIFGEMQPDYSHLTKAISELGALGAAHALAWNMSGFIAPGLLLMKCGAGLAFAIDRRRSALWWLLVLSGFGFTGAGLIPTEMRNGSPDYQSPLTLCHILMSFASGIPWLAATLLLTSRVGKNPAWHRLHRASVVFAGVGIAAYAINFFASALPFFPRFQGIAQRIFFAVYFGLVSLLFSASASKSFVGPVLNPEKNSYALPTGGIATCNLNLERLAHCTDELGRNPVSPLSSLGKPAFSRWASGLLKLSER